MATELVKVDDENAEFMALVKERWFRTLFLNIVAPLWQEKADCELFMCKVDHNPQSREFSPDHSDFIANILLEAPGRKVLVVTKTEGLCADISRAVYTAVIADKEHDASIVQMQKKYFTFTVDNDRCSKHHRAFYGLSADMSPSVYPHGLSASHIFVFF